MTEELNPFDVVQRITRMRIEVDKEITSAAQELIKSGADNDQHAVGGEGWLHGMQKGIGSKNTRSYRQQVLVDLYSECLRLRAEQAMKNMGYM